MNAVRCAGAGAAIWESSNQVVPAVAGSRGPGLAGHVFPSPPAAHDLNVNAILMRLDGIFVI
jgi:hypothetical protein